MRSRNGRSATRLAVSAVIGVLGLAAAPAAFAADTFVDGTTGSDANSCTSAGSPCATVGAGITKSGAGDTVHVAPGTYDEDSLVLANGRSLIATGTPASTIIDSGPNQGASALFIDSTGAGTVQGFTFRGETSGSVAAIVRIDGNVTLTGNIFDEDDDTDFSPSDVGIEASASPTITQNTFTDDGDPAGGAATAIVTHSTGSPTISENRIARFFTGISMDRGTPTISGNDITQIHNSSTAGVGAAIISSTNPTTSAAPTIVANFVHDGVSNGQLPEGIELFGDGNTSGGTSGGTLRRNRVSGYQLGIRTLNTDGPVTLNSDLVTGNSLGGINAIDTLEATGVGDITATNVTAWGNTPDFNLQDAVVTLNSVITEDPIRTSDGNGGAGGNQGACTITFSRGPTTTPGGNGCLNFQTTASPGFVNSGAGDFHLASGSAMIDAGDPTDPGVGAQDVDGDGRAEPGSCLGGGTPPRDIGADEFVVDCGSLPDTQIDTGPANAATSGSSTSFGFSSASGGVAGFQCSLDGANFTGCTSAKSLVGLGDGSHTFAVRAVNTGGEPDPSPATRTWTVDATPPTSQFDSGPANGGTSNASPAFGFSSPDGGTTFKCQLDGGASTACTSPQNLGGLSDGSHTFAIRTTDAVGNVELSPVSRTFTVDGTPPATQIDSGPAEGSISNNRSPSFAFSSEPGASFECSLDGGSFSACTSPKTLSGLSDGAHTFRVRAIDGVGNTDASPAARSFSVDSAAPALSLGPPPPSPSRDTTPTFTFSSEPGARFECRIDAGPFAACASPFDAPSLADGSHTFSVRAIDIAGNVADSGAVPFVIDTEPPVVKLKRARVKGRRATFTFKTSEAASAQCQLDKKRFRKCKSPVTFRKLKPGKHRLRIRATDAAGNATAKPLTKKFKVKR